MLTSLERALLGLDLVIVSTGLLSPLIYRISSISLLLYDSRIAIISIIRRFSLVVLSFTIQLYSEYESVQTTRGIRGSLSCVIIIWRVVEIEIAILIPATILYNSEARTARVTLLHLVEL